MFNDASRAYFVQYDHPVFPEYLSQILLVVQTPEMQIIHLEIL